MPAAKENPMIIKEVTAPGDKAILVRFDDKEEVVAPWTTVSFCVEDTGTWVTEEVCPTEVETAPPFEPTPRYVVPDDEPA